MDGTAAIEQNRAALKRILASLVAMAGAWVQFTLFPREGASRQGLAQAEKSKLYPAPTPAPTLPRHLHRAILRLLRPAESAARRLIIAAALGMLATLPPPRRREHKPVTIEPVLRRLGIAITLSPDDRARNAAEMRAAALRAARPRIWHLPLIDPPKRLLSLSKGGLSKGSLPNGSFRRHQPQQSAPRILFPGFSDPSSFPMPPSPDDPIIAARLGQRLAALAAALDDLPGQARRFARWQARGADAVVAQSKNREAAENPDRPGRFRCTAPLRRGRPPGGRLSRFDPSATHPARIREIDEILAHAHALALCALAYPDTS